MKTWDSAGTKMPGIVRKRPAIAIFVLGVAVVLLVFFNLRKSPPLREGNLKGVTEEFFALVPDDIPQEQRDEIQGLLRRFQAKADAGQIRVEDEREVMELFIKYLNQGSIERDELNLVMAKVGYYSYRALSPDSSDIHPLLDPVEAPPDTARLRHRHD